MLNIDYTVFIQIANFLILLVLLNIIAYRPIRGILNRRKEAMSSSAGKTDEWTKAADGFSNELESSTSKTIHEGFIQKEGLKNEGLDNEKLMLNDAFSSVEENLSRARAEIQAKLAEARESLQADLDSFSKDLAKKVLGRNI
jgi:F-type H+-transporting ATPase subunit b